MYCALQQTLRKRFFFTKYKNKYFLFTWSIGVLPEKKFEADKRGVNLGDFNDMMRKDRSGFRLPNSKEMGAADSGPYFEKVSIHICFWKGQVFKGPL